MQNSLLARGIVWTVLATCVCGIAVHSSAADLGTVPPPLIVQPVNAADTAVLHGNTRPEAAPAADQGLVESNRQLDLMLVLQRSPEQERALAAFNERQQDPSSPDYHHWLSAEEFGAAYGPSDHDIGAVSAWLVGSGFESFRVNKGRTLIEFSGNAARVQQALKIQLHRYLVDGTEQMANDRDPQIPYALSPVVRGIVGLNDFPIHSPMHSGRYVERNLSTGKYTVLKPSVPPLDGASPAAEAPVQPDFTFDDGGGTNPHACSYSSYDTIVYQGNGGTSAASPYWSGIMAMVLQKHGGAKQGLAIPTLYKLAAKETLSSCNTATVKSGNTCTFYDIASGTNAQPCKRGDPNCVTKTAGDAYGILSGYSATTGYDMTTGLGSVNIANLVDNWGTSAPPPFVFVSTESLSFAATAVGSASAAQTITVKNTGAVAIALTSGGIMLTGTAAASFTKTTTCGSSLAVGASCTISITFKPTAAGSLTATLSIADNAANSPQRVGLSGTGAATLTVSPASLTFAATALGSTSKAQTVTVKNTGKVAATIASGGITLTGSSAFTKTTTCGSSLAIGASCTISVSFKPVAAGSLAATLSIGDDGIGSPQKVSLSGTGG